MTSGQNSNHSLETTVYMLSRHAGKKSSRTKVPLIFANFRPEFCPRVLLRIFPEIFELSCFVSWETETRKNHQHFFNAKFPGKFEEKSIKVFWRAGKVS